TAGFGLWVAGGRRRHGHWLRQRLVSDRGVMQRGLEKLVNSGKLRAKMEILRLGPGHREGKSSEVSFVNVAGQQKREAAFTVKAEAVAGVHVAENAGAIDDSRL